MCLLKKANFCYLSHINQGLAVLKMLRSRADSEHLGNGFTVARQTPKTQPEVAFSRPRNTGQYAAARSLSIQQRVKKTFWGIQHRKGKNRSRPISRVLSWTAIHLRQTSPFACSDLPGSRADHTFTLPYLVLLRVGFTLPLLLPTARCALTTPFHPYLPRSTQVEPVRAVYFLWHLP